MTDQGIHMTGSVLASSLQDWFIRFNFREPGASTVAAESDALFWLIFLQSTFFFILLMVLMVVLLYLFPQIITFLPNQMKS